MLVLSREAGEGFHFFNLQGQHLGHIHVECIQGSRVRLSFDFPDEVKILREEVPFETQPSEVVNG